MGCCRDKENGPVDNHQVSTNVKVDRHLSTNVKVDRHLSTNVKVDHPLIDLRHKNNLLSESSKFGIERPQMKCSYFAGFRQDARALQQIVSRVYQLAALNNIGNTCFLNTAIKCICAPSEFITNCKPENAATKYESYAREFYQLINAVLTEKIYNPRAFKDQLATLDKTFIGNGQNDCFQTAVTILDLFHRAVKKNSDKSLPPFISETLGIKENESKTEDERNAKLFQYANRCTTLLLEHFSIVYNSFLNVSMNIYHCPTCNNDLAKFEIMTGIPLDIVKSAIPSQTIHLSDCIKRFYETDVFKGYVCKSCHATIDIQITREPLIFAPIIIFQLKRMNISYITGKYEKDNTYVEFPLVLNMLDYVPQYIKHKYYDNTMPCSYNLVGVGMHFGSLEGGHYYACIYNKSRQTWEEHNDSTVRDIPVKEVMASASAITLVYQVYGNGEEYIHSLLNRISEATH